jgi:hypothetical protein
MHSVFRFAVIGVLASGCGQDQITPLPSASATAAAPAPKEDSGNPCARVCAPGATQLCYCPDTHQSAQICEPGGAFWMPCPCGAVTVKVDAGQPH